MTPYQVDAAVTIFAFTYLVIASRRLAILNLNRPGGVLVGALLMVMVAGMPVDAAYAAIDLNTLTLLLGMMLVSAYLTLSGFFAWVAWRIQARAGTPGRVLALLMVTAAGLSALFVNDTICLLMTPLVLQVTTKRNPVPYLLGLVTASNIGGMATLVGNPQNMLIGMYSGIDFAAFSARMTPIALVCLGVAYAVLRGAYRTELGGPWLSDDVPEPPLDRVVCGRMLGIVGLMLIAFLFPTGDWLPFAAKFKLPMVAIAGGALAIIIGRYDPDRSLRRSDTQVVRPVDVLDARRQPHHSRLGRQRHRARARTRTGSHRLLGVLPRGLADHRDHGGDRGCGVGGHGLASAPFSLRDNSAAFFFCPGFCAVVLYCRRL